MAQFYSAKRKPAGGSSKRASQGNRAKGGLSPVLEKIELSVDAVDHHGNALCLSHKPLVVIEGGFLNETYLVRIRSKKSSVWHGDIAEVLEENTNARQKPFCPYVKDCGGCSHQYIKPHLLLAEKESAVRSYISKNIDEARLESVIWEPALSGSENELTNSQYRRRARISLDARDLKNIKVGFRRAKSNKVVDIGQCAVLSPGIQALYPDLISCLKTLPDIAHVGHITLTEGSAANQICIHLTKPLKASSIAVLSKLCADKAASHHEKSIQLVTQLKSGDFRVIAPQLTADESDTASLELKDSPGLSMWVRPNQFIQVNQSINGQMLKKASEWLQLEASDKDVHLIDLFSGVGNFGIALASSVNKVDCYEGVTAMVQQARANAQYNGIDNVTFHHLDLNQDRLLQQLSFTADKEEGQPLEPVLIVDPSREGAFELMKQLSDAHKRQYKGKNYSEKSLPTKILYVSCNPTSFVRDMNALPAQYKVSRLCVLDMFPYTKHIELMAYIEHT